MYHDLGSSADNTRKNTMIQQIRMREYSPTFEGKRPCSPGRAGMGDRDRLYGVEAAALSARPYSTRHGRAAGVATGRAKIAGETHPSVIGASQATARPPPYPDPKHITLRSQPVEGAIPNRWRANPEIKRPYGPRGDARASWQPDFLSPRLTNCARSSRGRGTR